jgi:hypothetical protein
MDTFSALQTSETAVLRGDFVILFRHGHWHLVGTKRIEDQRRIVTVHVMSAERARKTLAETPSAKPKSYSEFGSHFQAEVDTKVLPSAEDYLSLFRSKLVGLSAGFHTDTMQHASYTPETEQALLQAVSHMMLHGEPGLCLHFAGHAL